MVRFKVLINRVKTVGGVVCTNMLTGEDGRMDDQCDNVLRPSFETVSEKLGGQVRGAGILPFLVRSTVKL